MSRIGRKPIAVPDGVSVNIVGNAVSVTGPKGNLSRTLPVDISVVQEGKELLVQRPSDEKQHRSLQGLSRTLVSNMVEGVTKGFTRTLEMTGVGYRATLQGKKLVLTLGYSHPIEVEPRDGMEFEVPVPTRIIVKGIDKEKVGALAAEIRSFREPEPYKGKGVRYDNERIRRKAGKTGAKGKK
ncbi:MAG: 50S ribosomal protein L6 [Firmicutes bacterium]|nr:50S ribosomal protein L6 [Bacillota bacterium]